MTEQLTHWKKTTHPDYLGSYALTPEQDMILTIKSAATETITGTGGKKEEKLVIHFMENVKPMICNRTNAKVISKVHKTPYIEQWVGKVVQLYSARIQAFGEDVDALRIRDFMPQIKKINTSSAIDNLNSCTTLEELKTTFAKLSKEEAGHPDIIKLKDTLKSKLK